MPSVKSMKYMPGQIDFASFLATQNGFHCTDWLGAIDVSKELNNMTKVKVKSTLEQAKRAQRWSKYSSTLSLTSALHRGGWSEASSGKFTSLPGSDPLLIV